MKKLLILGLSAIAVSAFAPAMSAESVAHGYQMGDEKNMFGYISFPVSQFATPTMDKRNYGETHVSAGECVDGIYYTFEVYPDVMGGVSAMGYRVLNAKTFETLKSVNFYNDTRRVVDMTYDYTTNTMYALVEDKIVTSSIGTTSLNIVDLNTGDCIVVGSPGNLKAIDGNGKEVEESLITLAADAEGNLYAMGEYRQFYKLDKFTGKATQIGSQHSIATTNQFQSMAFDNEGVLYWAQSHPDYGYFLTIDPATGVPSYMAEDPNPETKWKNEASILGANAEVTGLYFEKEFSGKGPEAPADLTIKIADYNPNDAILSWTLPTVDLKGNPVTVSAVNVYRLGAETPIATLPADATSYTDQAAPGGNQSYMVAAVAGDEHGRGAVETIFVGADELMPVTDLKAEIENATVTITWKAPTATYHGGYADYDNITYRVWRIKGTEEDVIGDNIAETIFVDELTEAGTYYYSVQPITCGVIGYADDSNTVTYVKTASIPYFSGFENNQDGSLWTFVNNHTNTSYGWSVAAGYAYQRYDGNFAQLKSAGSAEPCNDYMFSPAIEFEPGTYSLEYMMNGSLSGDTHSWSIYIADAPSVDANMVADIESHEDEKVGSAWIKSPGSTFTIEKAGTYHLAFHGTTTATYCTLKIDNVSITKAPESIPYSCNFEEGTDEWTITNENPHQQRGAGWSMATDKNSPAGDKVLKLYVYGTSNGLYNDWAVSPAIKFDKEGTYVLTFGASGKSYDTHRWGAYLGTDAKDFSTFTLPIVEYDKAKFTAWTDYSIKFFVETPGIYYLGLHAEGCDAATTLYIDDIRIASEESGVTGVAIDMTAEPVEYFNLQGQRVESPESGLYIVRYSDGSIRKQIIRN
ncbi:MAG: fibronectin type III domain-containing protein [Muribaculaceae bacterium]|nr:fibronectin type III domain-containing protein [Muribaculaceae bacterium]